MVKRILKDEIYIGTLITHKTERKDIHKQGKKVKRENQYIFEKSSSIRISIQFERVQEMMKKRVKNSSIYTKKKRDYIFGGFLRCGECKR